MQTKNKVMAIIIATILLTSMAFTIVDFGSAHYPAWQIPTFAYVQPVINPVGRGQSAYIYMWIDKTFGTETAMTNNYRFHNYKLTITKPDGATEVKTWDTVWDTTSSQSYTYTPDQVGEYTLLFEFPGQAYADPRYGYSPNSAFVNDTYLPSSATATLVVQEEAVPYLPDNPLPSDYWNRPIYGENPNWWMISSNWLGSASPQFANWRSYTPDGFGSMTSHIMWTKQIQLSGGVVGGDDYNNPGDTFFEGSAYINRFVNPIIMDGKLFYKEPLNFGSADAGPEKCVDLSTGQVYWSRTDILKPSFGLMVAAHNPQQHGVMEPILVATQGSNWFGYDGDTGTWLWNFTGVPSGRKVTGPDGQYLQYVLTNKGTGSSPDWRLGQWNSTGLILNYTVGIRPGWTGVLNASDPTTYDWEVSIPWRNTMPNNPTFFAAYYGDLMLGYNGTLPASGHRTSPISTAPYTYFAVNLNASKGAVGSILWMKNYNPIIQNITVIQGANDPVNGVFVEKLKETNQWAGYSMRTGDLLWGPVGDQLDLDYYGNPGHEQVYAHIAYGKVYASGYSGLIWCYDEMTGKTLWSYGNGGPGNSTSSGFAVPGNYPIAINAIANGVIYTVTTEHTIQTPIYKGALARAINATDGTEIWTISADTAEFNEMEYAVADGYSVFLNGYDQQIYSLGRGPSKTTVTAPDLAAASDQRIVIRGTVTDVSTGTTQSTQALKFPNGVACAADSSMKDWMGYVYQQKALPANFTGVTVSIDVIDSNGNYRNIGTATTDATGVYSLPWLPDIPGYFTVIATFAGTNGYWPSHAETSFAVDAAPEPTAAPTQAPPSMADTYILPGIIAIIVVIIIIGALIMLMLRKRP